MDTNSNSNFIGVFAGSLRDRRTGLDPDPSGADSIHVSGCTPQLEFDAATTITTNRRIPISESLQAASGKGKFQPGNRNGCEKYNDSDDDKWFLGFDKKGKDMYMKHCKVLIEPIAESEHKKKGTKTDNKVVHVEREKERDPEVEMMVRRWTKKENKLVMRFFYQSDPTRRYQKRMIAIWGEIGSFEITEQRLVDQARVVRTNEWLTEVELEEIRRKILAPRDGEENQEINDIPVIEERIQNENGPM